MNDLFDEFVGYDLAMGTSMVKCLYCMVVFPAVFIDSEVE